MLTVRDVALRLRIAKSTVYALCARGELVHVRVSNTIRIAKAAVDAYCLERLKLHRDAPPAE